MNRLANVVERKLGVTRSTPPPVEALLAQRDAQLAEAHARLHQMAADRDDIIRHRTGALRRARDEAVAASAAKSAFLANMSHEIRTPLTSIIGFAELLLQPGEDAVDSRESLQTIVRNGRHLLEVINDILDLAKIETQQLALEEIELPLPVLLRDLNSLVSTRAEEKSLKFEILPHLPLPRRVRTDPVRLKQILLNFCSNAIKFTPRGKVTLALRYVADPPAMRFSVTDTGIGMSTEQLERLFQPFVQADASTTRKFGGTGLGLYISRQLATMLGGQVRVESKVGHGSRFHLDLPLSAPVPDGELLTMEGDLIEHRHADFAITNIPPPALRGRVLVAEDGADNQRLISAFLRQAGVVVTMVANGKDAVETALAQDFDLVLMDVQMPVLDGIAATQMLRATGYGRPIVALTANVMKADLQRYRDAGCDDVLAKPMDRNHFYQVVAQQLEKQTIHAPVLHALDDAEFLRGMADMTEQFRARLPDTITSIERALNASDWPMVRSLVHKLRGTAGSYGYGQLTVLAGTVEDEIRAGRGVSAVALCKNLIAQARTAPS